MLYHEVAGLRKGLISLVLLFNVSRKESSLNPTHKMSSGKKRYSQCANASLFISQVAEIGIEIRVHPIPDAPVPTRFSPVKVTVLC